MEKAKPQVQSLLRELEQLVSEESNPQTADIDVLTTEQILTRINQEDSSVPEAIKACIGEISQAVDLVLESFSRGARLIYMGAGTSGRLGILDAVECPPTFSVPHEQVVGLIAGGHQAIFKAVEGAEDSSTLAAEDLAAIGLSADDTVVAIAASGRTPYVIGGLQYADDKGASTVAVTCNPGAPILDLAQVGICARVGPEVLTGSTRMKSGTAQKLILNMITTAAMIKSGKSYQNLMVDVHASNAKLQARAVRIVMQAAECDAHCAEQALQKSAGSAKLAILMIRCALDYAGARALLDQHGGFLRQAIAYHDAHSV